MTIRSYQHNLRSCIHVARHAAADDQAVGRARHRHVKQAAIFILDLAQHRRAGRRDGRGSSAFLPAQTTTPGAAAPPDPRQLDQSAAAAYPRARTWYRPETPPGLQSLGAVHGHDADFVARDFHVALHFEVGGAQPRHEALQRGRRLALIAQREFEKFVERVIGLVAEPPQDALPAAVAAEQPGIEGKWRLLQNAALACFKALKRDL